MTFTKQYQTHTQTHTYTSGLLMHTHLLVPLWLFLFLFPSALLLSSSAVYFIVAQKTQLMYLYFWRGFVVIDTLSSGYWKRSKPTWCTDKLSVKGKLSGSYSIKVTSLSQQMKWLKWNMLKSAINIPGWPTQVCVENAALHIRQYNSTTLQSLQNVHRAEYGFTGGLHWLCWLYNW